MAIRKNLLLILFLLVAGLIPALAPALAAPAGPLVLAAASLQEAMEDAASAWEGAGHPRPVVSFASSAALARQIEAGAPADLFLSADDDWMDHVERAGRLRPGSRVSLLSNRLALVAPVASPLRLTIAPGFPLVAALRGGYLAMADPDSVPAGKYGAAALRSLGVWAAVAPHVARAENVRAALALVERGAAPLGIVYATDARASAKVRVVALFPEASHPPIRYPLALLAASANPDAMAFYRFLRSPAGLSLFTRRGFAASGGPDAVRQ